MPALPYAQMASVLRALREGSEARALDEVGSPDARRLCTTFESLLDLPGSVRLAEALEDVRSGSGVRGDPASSGAGEAPTADPARVHAFANAVKARLASVEQRLEGAFDRLLGDETVLGVDALLEALAGDGPWLRRDGSPAPALLSAARHLWPPAQEALSAPCVRAKAAVRELRAEALPKLLAVSPVAARVAELDAVIGAVTADAAAGLEERFEGALEQALVRALATIVVNARDEAARGSRAANACLEEAAAEARRRGGGVYRVLMLAQNGLRLLVRHEARRLEALVDDAVQSFCV